VKDESAQPRRSRGGSSSPPSRKLNFVSRVRGQFRRGADRVLGADYAWSGAFVVLVVLLVGAQRCGGSLDDHSLGDVTEYDIRAPFDFLDVQQGRTGELRRAARDTVPEMYVYDAERGARVAGRLGELFETGRQALQQASLDGSDPGDAVRVSLADQIPEPALQVLISVEFDPSVERELKGALTEVLDERIVASKSLLELQSSIVLSRVRERLTENISDYTGFTDLDMARNTARDRVRERLLLPVADKALLADLVASFVDANVQLDAAATHEAREEAASRVALEVVPRVRGEVLVKKGERINADHLATLENARRTSSAAFDLRQLLALVFVTTLLAFFLYRYASYHQRNFRKIQHLHALMVLVCLSTLSLAWAVLWLSAEVVDSLNSPFNQLSAYPYLVPLGVGSILVALLANGRIAIVYSAFVALLFGAMNGWNGYFMVWAMLVQCAGIHAISTYRERSALLRAGWVVGGAGAVSAIAMETLRGGLEPLSRTFYSAGLALVGGAVGVGLLVSFSLPLLEGLFNVLTDIRLLELSNVNIPLLSRLGVKAPGTYNHSLVVGTLAEEGAKAIGASSLFCRVAAVYHDIGKMNKPEYFVENQQSGNPHDRLSPHMSALIIASHVKDGIKMAREAGLPETIVDIIPQHHGTRLMTYFYEKAKSEAAPSHSPIKEEDFRYPGPKPQTREAAIFMLADSVEAAARTVAEPTSNRLRDVIQKVSNAVVLDQQLEECDLTFADLHRIQEAFHRLLVSMYHHRVEYPGFEFNRAAKSGEKVVDRKTVRGS